MNICESCILYGRCSGDCGDVNPSYYEEQELNDYYDSKDYQDNDYE